MATIEKRGEFQYQARIRKAGFPPQTRTFETYKEAYEWAVETEAAMVKGTFIDTKPLKDVLLKDLLERYRIEVTPSHKGHIRENHLIRRLQRSEIAQREVLSLFSDDFVRYRNERLQEVAPATVTKEMNLFSTVFNTAVSEWGMGRHGLTNPVSPVKRPRTPPGRTRRLHSEAELEAILNEVHSEPVRLAILLAIETAMRRSEMVNTPRKEADLVRRVLRLRDTKNGSSRVVPLSTKAVEIIKQLPPTQDGRLMPSYAACWDQR